ncbi:MAG: hypothetical protein U5K69_28500 [Balneolaceae bacterium]|nr:hypothetical protein [Balneolaceae bacterium]
MGSLLSGDYASIYPNQPLGRATSPTASLDRAFQPAVGFTPRNAFRRLQPSIAYTPQFTSSDLVQQIRLGASGLSISPTSILIAALPSESNRFTLFDIAFTTGGCAGVSDPWPVDFERLEESVRYSQGVWSQLLSRWMSM